MPNMDEPWGYYTKLNEPGHKNTNPLFRLYEVPGSESEVVQ